MLSRFIDLRISSRRLMTSVSPVRPRSSAFCTRSCWSMVSRRMSLSRFLISSSAAGPEPIFSWTSWMLCSRALISSDRVMMALLTRAMISSITVSAAKAVAHATHTPSSRSADFLVRLLMGKWRPTLKSGTVLEFYMGGTAAGQRGKWFLLFFPNHSRSRMKLPIVAFAFVLAGVSVAAAQNAAEKFPDLQQLNRMAARFAPTPLRVDTARLSAGDRQALVTLIAAARVLDTIYMNQLWSG